MYYLVTHLANWTFNTEPSELQRLLRAPQSATAVLDVGRLSAMLMDVIPIESQEQFEGSNFWGDLKKSEASKFEKF